ncbi:MAG: hypothetical protein QOG59_1371 [Solirubrobacteraceae bacterium]|nr:hypothetical protein [Solirubrobacteraceae bacterium]
MISLWPTTILEDGYQSAAKTNPFMDPLHPAGYALILAGIGAVTHQVVVAVFLQHLSGIASALLLWAATRRVTGSSWAGLLPAGIILLDADEVFLEHSIMSESWVVLATSIGLYATARALDQPERSQRWSLCAGAALAIAVTIRSANLALVAVVVVVLLIGQPRTRKRVRLHWRAAAAAGGLAVVILVAFAGANARFGMRFGIAPAPGWYLYGRAAQFADCSRFTPPPGTTRLCETTPPSRRPSGYYYMFLPQAPAPRLFGAFGSNDAVLGGWAKRAVLAQFGDFLTTAWSYLRSYYVPGTLPARLRPLTTELDPQLDFTNRGNVIYVAAAHQALENFFARFTMRRVHWGLQALRRWQLVFRFGATMLCVATVLTLIGLATGGFRSRAAVFLFGVGGLSLIIAPVLTGTYSGRYTVPMAGPLMAAAAVTIGEVWSLIRKRSTPTQ